MRAVAKLSSTALDLDRIDEAKEYAKKLIDFGDDAEELLRLGNMFQRRRMPDVAYGAYKKASEVSPNGGFL